MHGQEILINQLLIHEQLEISNEAIVNATFDEAKTTLKKIASPHAFIENEQCSVAHMKAEFHAKFVAILQKLYQKE